MAGVPRQQGNLDAELFTRRMHERVKVESGVIQQTLGERHAKMLLHSPQKEQELFTP